MANLLLALRLLTLHLLLAHTLLIGAALLPLALLLAVPAIAAIGPHIALLTLDLLTLHLLALRLRTRGLTLGAAFAAAAAPDFGAARTTVAAIAAIVLRDLHSLAGGLCRGGSDGGEDRRSDQQPSEHLLHLAILQFMSRTLEAPAGKMKRKLPQAI
ncbi:hypothetical protein [Sphingopyxis macrogoltabida]|uniref:hypothetical protein n=1 Tax=Sphingopyxis macrogoltabida TaxID=33050 RepID=UPI001F1BE39A|nr:hypothetical protein [Sphingopyxis macrogoltabida]